jgi:hypothetical protein
MNKASRHKGYVIMYALLQLLVLAGMLVLSGQAWAGAEEGARATGRSFSVPVPQGFFFMGAQRNRQPDPLRAAGGLVLVQVKRPSFDNAFLASVVVVPARIPGNIDLQDEGACAKVAKGSADSLTGTVQTAAIVQLSNGKHCQYTVRSRENINRGATGTVFSTPKESWVVTCNYDTRDAEAMSACTDVVNGWKFE